jgi:hypothetical protein
MGGFQQQPGFDPRFGPAGGIAQLEPSTSSVGIAPARKASPRRNRALIGVAAALVVAMAGVLFATKFFGLLSGPSDPGCRAYANTALSAYNQTIKDLNAQASQAVLGSDMTATINDLTSASAQSQSASTRSALNALLAEFKVIRADVAAGAVPASTVKALNADSAAADSAC